MPIILVGSDPRYEALSAMLRENGMDARLLAAPRDARGAEALIARYPLDETAQAALDELAPEAELFLLATREIDAALKARFRAHSLLDDALFVYENAVLTAEGALSAAMSQTPFALMGENALVIGYGRIGRALTERLIALGARVTVVSRRENGRLAALSRGARAADVTGLNSEISEARLIFVTSPDRMLGPEELSYVSRRAYLYDLSGPPYGLDLEAALALKLHAARESALPGRYCPESAARAMHRAIVRIWNGGKEK